jgi:hypothetical protein
MLNHIKKSIQISGISAILLGTAILNGAPAQAVDVSQMLGADLTWQCGLSPTIQPRIRLNQNENSQDSVRFNILPCEPKPEPKPEPAPEPPVTQLIQQGVQLLQTAQPLIQQLIQPLTSIAAPPAPQSK